MKCISFERLTLTRILKNKKIYTLRQGDINLQQAFVSSLPKLLASQSMKIIEETFRLITIPQVGYIRQVILLRLRTSVQTVLL